MFGASDMLRGFYDFWSLGLDVFVSRSYSVVSMIDLSRVIPLTKLQSSWTSISIPF